MTDYPRDGAALLVGLEPPVTPPGRRGTRARQCFRPRPV